MHIELNILVNFAPTILARVLIHDDPISRPNTYILVKYEYIHLILIGPNSLTNWSEPLPVLHWCYGCTLFGINLFMFMVFIL